MLELPDFGQMSTFTIQFESRDKIFAGDVIDRNYDLIIFISKCRFLRRPRVTTFADIIKIITRFIKKIFKDSRKVKRIGNYVSKCNLYMYFLT